MWYMVDVNPQPVSLSTLERQRINDRLRQIHHVLDGRVEIQLLPDDQRDLSKAQTAELLAMLQTAETNTFTASESCSVRSHCEAIIELLNLGETTYQGDRFGSYR